MNVKRLLAFVLSVVMALSLCGPALADGETEISSAQDLLQLGARPDGSFVLTRDIDMAGMDWTPVAFAGTLRGNGHTLYNLRVTSVGDARANTVDGNDKVYDSVFAGLFSTLIGARVDSLTIRGADIDITSAEHCFVGGLAGYIKNTEITNCAVLDGRISLTAACQPDPNNPRTSCNAGVGGIAGFGSGTISNTRAEVTLVFDDRCSTQLRCEEFMGGILSTGNADISGCAVVIDGYDACRGYAHNGGLVGMFYLYDKQEPVRAVLNSTVDGKITFFEDNADRRAYCQPFVGEALTYPAGMTGCSHTFVTNELFDYTVKLNPEKCDAPALTEEVVAATCDNWGCTVHTCSTCGHTWRDTFVAPAHEPGEWEVVNEPTQTENGLRQLKCVKCGQIIAQEALRPHVPGDWVTVKEAGVDRDGLRQLLCADCGAVLQEEIIPGKKGVQAIVLSEALLEMYYKDDRKLTAEIYPADADNPILLWSSSDERVVTVDTDGTIHAVGGGSAVVTCASADGKASGECAVRVKLTFRQWLTRIFLFGWIRN